jgi:hypothetical protein
VAQVQPILAEMSIPRRGLAVYRNYAPSLRPLGRNDPRLKRRIKERADHDIPAEVVQEAIGKTTIEPAGRPGLCDDSQQHSREEPQHRYSPLPEEESTEASVGMRQRLMRVLLVAAVGALGRVFQRKLQERKQGAEGTSRKLPPYAPTSPGYPDIPNLPSDPAGKA